MKIQIVLTLVSLNNWYSEDKTTAESFVSSSFEKYALMNHSFRLDLFNYINHKVLYDDLCFEHSYFTKAIKELVALEDDELINTFSYSHFLGKDKILVITSRRVDKSSFKFSDLTWEKK
ncbi:hypothetical protein FDH01_gp136 [Acinetobacter phage vB_AbaM_ME3]|uniref:Uncharacterized protein n=1 Tax=Acinetobacter phage vB_AbaM_ME3 TaxID=1837876 RepID=A0A172Q0V9_9CAUD|nr:hypothetical protein FDH01_gp136 [Acinetobacter phage vB_AbaM_ME3]AND75486.1 hypothetical protein ME3_325 [Acinetobacter phage vB_AbaM_ME3]